MIATARSVRQVIHTDIHLTYYTAMFRAWQVRDTVHSLKLSALEQTGAVEIFATLEQLSQMADYLKQYVTDAKAQADVVS